MPVTHFPITGAEKTILYPAYYKIIEDVCEAINIETPERVILNKNINISPADNRSNVGIEEKDNLPTTVSKRRLIVNIDENYNEDAISTTAIHQIENYYVFEDKDINVFVYPIYVKTDINFEFTYFAPSLSEANKIRDGIRIKASQARNILIHDVEYDILLPEIIEEFIADVHENKKRFQNLSLEEYFRTYSTKRMHLITDMSNKENARIAYHEKQTRIVGTFDFILPEKIEKDNETNTYSINFNYKLSLDVPKAFTVRYPVMLCNRPLKSKYLRFIKEYKKNSKEEFKKNLSYSLSLNSLSFFEAHRLLENRIDINIPTNIPMFDDFTEKCIHKGYIVLYSFLVQIDENDKKTLFNLSNLGEYIFNDKILKFIKDIEKEYIVNPYQSFLYLGLQQDDHLYDLNVLEITNDLTVKSKIELSLFKPTRVLLSINIDISMLNENAIKRLIEYNNRNEYKDIFFIMLNEQLFAIENLKQELFITVSPNSFISQSYLKILYEFYKVDNRENALKLLLLLKDSDTLFKEFITILKNNYRFLFDYILDILKENNLNFKFISNSTVKDILTYIEEINTSSFNRENYIGSNFTSSFKTVQTTYIVAENKQPI